MGRASILQAVWIHPLMSPRARDDRCAKHRLLWSTSWMVAWASRLFVRSRRHGLSLPCPWGRNGSGSVTPTQRKTSRTRCVWGNTVVPELPSPPQRARPFHSHSIQTPASRFSIAKGVQTQASPFHLSRSVPHPFGFLGGPSVPAFLHHRLVVGLLVLPMPWSKTSLVVTGTGSHRVSLPQGS